MKAAYIYLTIAVLGEVVGTSALKASEHFTKFWPTSVVVVGYIVAFYFLTLVLDTLPIGVTYAIWSGLGVIFIAVFAAIIYGQIPDWPAILGMGLIVLGVIIINLFSKTVSH